MAPGDGWERNNWQVAGDGETGRGWGEWGLGE